MIQGLEKLKEEFRQIQDWESKYKKIIELGRSLPEMPEALKTEEAKVKGCQSQVWLHAKLRNGKVYLEGESDALIVRGLVAILLNVYSDLSPEQILTLKPDFLNELGFSQNLSPSRTNGLYSMIKQIQMFAFAFKTLTDRGVLNSNS